MFDSVCKVPPPILIQCFLFLWSVSNLRLSHFGGDSCCVSISHLGVFVWLVFCLLLISLSREFLGCPHISVLGTKSKNIVVQTLHDCHSYFISGHWVLMPRLFLTGILLSSLKLGSSFQWSHFCYNSGHQRMCTRQFLENVSAPPFTNVFVNASLNEVNDFWTLLVNIVWECLIELHKMTPAILLPS
jgi:hypothetical protein